MRSPAVKFAVLFSAVLAACGAPEYRSPPVPVPAHFREPADPAATAPAPNAVPSAFPRRPTPAWRPRPRRPRPRGGCSGTRLSIGL